MSSHSPTGPDGQLVRQNTTPLRMRWSPITRSAPAGKGLPRQVAFIDVPDGQGSPADEAVKVTFKKCPPLQRRKDWKARIEAATAVLRPTAEELDDILKAAGRRAERLRTSSRDDRHRPGGYTTVVLLLLPRIALMRAGGDRRAGAGADLRNVSDCERDFERSLWRTDAERILASSIPF